MAIDQVIGGVPVSQLVERFGSPLYVYDAAVIRDRARRLISAFDGQPVRFFYAAKANANRHILEVIRSEGLCLDAVSLGEAMAAKNAGFPPECISYNGNNVTLAELTQVLDEGVHVSVDSLDDLNALAASRPGSAVGIRVNTDIGAGHHDHVVTGGPESKFGVDATELLAVKEAIDGLPLTIDGLHQHIGSGILDIETMAKAADALLEVAKRFARLRFVDFGGGIGIPYRPEEDAVDPERLRRRLLPALDSFARKQEPGFEFRFQPGRFVVAESGTLLVSVTNIKRSSRHTFVGTDSGMNHLLRPALYGAYHGISLARGRGGPPERYTVVGNVCESGDVFGKDRRLDRLEIGDVLAIANAGAYGMSMASTYNLRPTPAEVLIEDGAPRIIRPRPTIDSLF